MTLTRPALLVASDEDSLTAVDEAVDRAIVDLGSPESRRTYECAWRFYTHWLSEKRIPVTAVRPMHIQDYAAKLRDEGKVKGTVSRSLTIIRSLYKSIACRELMETNPAREVPAPKINSSPKRPLIRDAADIEKFINVPYSTWQERRDFTIVRLMVGLGWRRAEIARASVEDIEGTAISAIVKGGKKLTVGVPDWLAWSIVGWCAYAGIMRGPLFPRRPDDPRPVNGAGVYHIVKKMCARAGIAKVPPHAIRRTYITHLRKRDVDLKTLQQAVGHESSETTAGYDRLNSAASNAPGNKFGDLVRS